MKRPQLNPCDVEFEPELSLPADWQSEPPANLFRKVRSTAVGLVNIQVDCRFTLASGEAQEQTIQKITVIDPAANSVPDLTHEEMSRKIYFRAHQFVEELLVAESVEAGSRLVFVCKFYTHTKRSQITFQLFAVSKDLVGDEEEEEEDDREEEREDEEGEEEDDEGDDEDEDEDEDEDDDEDDDTTAAGQRRRIRELRSIGSLPNMGPGVRPTTAGFPSLPRPMSAERPDRHSRGPMMRRPSSFAHEDNGGLMRRGLGRVSEESESDIVKLMKTMAEMQLAHSRQTMERDAHFFAELRASFTAMRVEFQYFTAESRHELASAREHANRAHERLFQLSNMSGSYMENQAKANDQGWHAFRSGLEMMVETAGRKGEEQSRIHQMELQHLAYRHQLELERERHQINQVQALPAAPSTPSTGGSGETAGFVRNIVAPLAAAITTAALRAKGQEQAASIVDNFMDAYSQGAPSDDEEDDEEDDEVSVAAPIIKVPSAPRPKSKQPDPLSDNPPVHLFKLPEGFSSIKELFDKQPIVGMLLCLRHWITKDQQSEITSIIGKPAWNALDNASKQKKDSLAILTMIPIKESLKQEGIREKVTAVLQGKQRDLLNDLLIKVEQKIT